MIEQAGTGARGGDGFLPPALLSRILHKDAIEHELRKLWEGADRCPFDPVEMTRKVLGPLAEEDDESESLEGNKRSYLFVVAILALLDKVRDIGDFVGDNDGGIWDGDLPLQLYNGDDGSCVLRHRHNSQLIRCFETWTDSNHKSFSDYQWRLLVQTFALNDDNTIQELQLPDETIFPWCEEQLQSQNEAMSGGYGSVKKVKIHPLCHEFHERLKAVCVIHPPPSSFCKGHIATNTAVL